MKLDLFFPESFIYSFQPRLNYIIRIFNSIRSNRIDVTDLSENFINKLFDKAFKTTTINTNIENDNFKTIDGINDYFAIQTTFRIDTKKLYDTVNGYRDNEFYDNVMVGWHDYPNVNKLYIVTLGDITYKHETLKKAKDKSNNLFKVEIYSANTLVNLFKNLNYDEKEKIIFFLEEYIKKLTGKDCRYLFDGNEYKPYGNKSSCNNLLATANRNTEAPKNYIKHINNFFNFFYNDININNRERRLICDTIMMKLCNNRNENLHFPIDVSNELNQYIYGDFDLYRINLENLGRQQFILHRNGKWILTFPKKYILLANDILNFSYQREFSSCLYKIFVKKDCSDFSNEIENIAYDEMDNYYKDNKFPDIDPSFFN